MADATQFAAGCSQVTQTGHAAVCRPCPQKGDVRREAEVAHMHVASPPPHCNCGGLGLSLPGPPQPRRPDQPVRGLPEPQRLRARLLHRGRKLQPPCPHLVLGCLPSFNGAYNFIHRYPSRILPCELGPAGTMAGPSPRAGARGRSTSTTAAAWPTGKNDGLQQAHNPTRKSDAYSACGGKGCTRCLPLGTRPRAHCTSLFFVPLFLPPLSLLLCGRGDVIVVTANYRLGALGFLVTKAEVGRGGSSRKTSSLNQS